MSNTIQTVPVDQIHEPTRSEKLHPYEDEDDEDWEEFRASVGTQPSKLPSVRENGDGYELIDGDRRLRAVRENDAEEVTVRVRYDVETTEDLLTQRVIANENRKNSDPKQRARYIAQLCAPWLLAPGDRRDDIDEIHTQTEVGEIFGKAQGQISQWMNPLEQDEHPLRAGVAEHHGGRTVDQEGVELIDETIELLDDIVLQSQHKFVGTELADMEGVSLREIHSAVEQGVDQGWNSQQFLEYVEENFAIDDTSLDDDVETGVLGDQPDFDEPMDPSEFQEDTTSEDTSDEEFEFEIESGDIDWSALVQDQDLEEMTVSEAEQKKMQSVALEDDASVALEILQGATGMSKKEIVSEFLAPVLVREAQTTLREQF